ncbi:MAG: pilus assembly FimT family protein [Rickettsiales bacterium]
MNNTYIQRRGFSLIEISIVLVVIALIIGGIAAGRSLIRNSEMQSVIKESTAYTQAIGSFRQKYLALPGDFSGATALWGAADADFDDCKITASSNGVVTCDGDGNGRIMNQGAGNSDTYYEQFRAWQHLSNAGFIDGNYSGIASSGTLGYRIGVTIPESKFGRAGWRVLTVTTRDITELPTPNVTEMGYQLGDIPPGVVLWWGGNNIDNSLRMTPIISSGEAFTLDTKIDDGMGGTGKLVGQINSTGTCYNSSTMAYKPVSDNVSCALIFKTGH